MTEEEKKALEELRAKIEENEEIIRKARLLGVWEKYPEAYKKMLEYITSLKEEIGELFRVDREEQFGEES